MKKKKIIVSVSLIIALTVLMILLSGCSLGRFAFNFKHRGPFGMNFNEKQKSQEEFNFKDKKFNSEGKCFNNEYMFKQNNENIPFMGIEMSQNTKDVKGVLVNSVAVGSPAEKSGIKSQDIIISFDSNAVNNPKELYIQVVSHKVGDNVKITVTRNGQNLELNLTLASSPNSGKNIEQDQQNNSQNSGQDNK
jgi:C-terminal processing protease CtpA/Prc